MANRKKGSIAIPFLVTFLIALLIVGGGALYIYKSLDINKESELDELYATEYGTATYEDSHTILFVLNVPEQKCSSTFLLMRSVPKEKKLLITGIPSNTITIFNEKQASLKEVYENSVNCVCLPCQCSGSMISPKCEGQSRTYCMTSLSERSRISSS